MIKYLSTSRTQFSYGFRQETESVLLAGEAKRESEDGRIQSNLNQAWFAKTAYEEKNFRLVNQKRLIEY